MALTETQARQVLVEDGFRRVDQIQGSGTYLILPEDQRQKTPPDFAKPIVARLRAKFPDAFLFGNPRTEETGVDLDERKTIRNYHGIVKFSGLKFYSVRDFVYPDGNPSGMMNRLVLKGFKDAKGEALRITTYRAQSASWKTIVEAFPSESGLVDESLQILNGIIVPRRLGIYQKDSEPAVGIEPTT